MLEKLIEIQSEMDKLLQEKAAVQATYDKSVVEFKALLDKGMLPIDNNLTKLQTDFDAEFNRVCIEAENTEKFSDDKFLEATGSKALSIKEGNFKIIRSTTTKRTLNQKKFWKLYPVKAKKIAKIELGKADNAVGKDNVDAICTKEIKVSYSWKVPELE
jgi:hypothetical protein